MRMCPKCGRKYDDKTLFCTECGVKTTGTQKKDNNTKKIAGGVIGAIIIGAAFYLFSMANPTPTPKPTPTPAPSPGTKQGTTIDYAKQADDYFFNTKEYDKAITAYTKAIEQDKDDARLYMNRGISYRKTGDNNKALADYNQAIKLKSDYAIAYYNRGYLYQSVQKYDNAIKDYTQAIKLQADDADYWNQRGLAYESKKDYAKAASDFKQALKISPNNNDIKVNLQRVNKSMNK